MRAFLERLHRSARTAIGLVVAIDDTPVRKALQKSYFYDWAEPNVAQTKPRSLRSRSDSSDRPASPSSEGRGASLVVSEIDAVVRSEYARLPSDAAEVAAMETADTFPLALRELVIDNDYMTQTGKPNWAAFASEHEVKLRSSTATVSP